MYEFKIRVLEDTTIRQFTLYLHDNSILLCDRITFDKEYVVIEKKYDAVEEKIIITVVVASDKKHEKENI